MDNFEQRLKEMQDKLNAGAQAARARTREELEGLKVRKLEGLRYFPTSNLSLLTSRAGPVNLTSELGFLDDVAEECFHFGRTLGRTMRTYPVFLCRTLEEFCEPLTRDVAMPDTARAQWIEGMKSQAENLAEAGKGGILGAHLPGHGCYLNGWLIARRNGVETDRDRDRDRDGLGRDGQGCPSYGTYGSYQPYRSNSSERSDQGEGLLKSENAWGDIVSTVLHEKFGHGFISELSTWGKERRRLNLDRFDIARRFNLKSSDSPTAAAMEEKYNLLFRSSRLCEEGYAEWVENYLWQKWQGASEIGPRYTASDVLAKLEELRDKMPEEAALEPLVEDLRIVFGDISPSPNLSHQGRGTGESPSPNPVSSTGQALCHRGRGTGESPSLNLSHQGRETGEAGASPSSKVGYRGRATREEIQAAVGEMGNADSLLGEVIIGALGKPLHYVLGYLLAEQVARRCGAAFTPYAVLIANNITYDLERTSIADLGHFLRHKPELNIDTRLAMIANLEPGKDASFKDTFRRINTELGLAVPRFL